MFEALHLRNDIDEKKSGRELDSIVVIYEALCFDVAQGQMNWAPDNSPVL